MPLTSVSFCGLNSITSNVASPNLLTIDKAVTGPMPLINPLLKYFIIPSFVFGFAIFAVLTLNCSPYLLCLIKLPSSSTHSPCEICGNFPTAVIFSPLQSITATV